SLIPAVAAAEELVSTADREQSRPSVDGLTEHGATGGEVGRDRDLLSILPAADIGEIEGAGTEVVANADRRDGQLVAAQGGPAREQRDVAAVGVDVQVLGIQMGDADSHARSQYGRTRPRSAATARSRSIAV